MTIGSPNLLHRDRGEEQPFDDDVDVNVNNALATELRTVREQNRAHHPQTDACSI